MKKRKNNNGVFYVVISLVAVLAVCSYAVAYSMTQTINVDGDYIFNEAAQPVTPEVVEEMLSASPGGKFFSPVKLYDSLTYGSGYYIATSSEGAASTLSKANLDTYLISFTSNTESYTFTMPATSTMISLLRGVGSTRSWLIHNATTTAETTLTIAEGAGMDIVAIDTNADVLAGTNYGKMTCTQIPYLDADNENIMCAIEEYVNAD